MRHIILVLTIINLFVSTNLKSRKNDTTKLKPPEIIEFLAGNNRVFSQIIFNKPISENKKIGVLNIFSFAAAYQNDVSNNEYVNFSALYYKFVKRLSINSGVSLNTAEGLKPKVDLQYIYIKKNISIVYLPAYYYLHYHKFFNLLHRKYASNKK